MSFVGRLRAGAFFAAFLAAFFAAVGFVAFFALVVVFFAAFFALVVVFFAAFVAFFAAALRAGRLRAGRGVSDLYLYPGVPVQVVGALFTNFHLPRSSLLMLVSALGGRERVLDAYAAAVRRGYRFYSYGDAMLLL